jgi:hypothetical protein
VVALIIAYNEEDIIGETIRHLTENGVGVYLIDNWSTDSTLAKVLGLSGIDLIGHEQFPSDGPSQVFEWTRLLARLEVVASRMDADWILSNDADEFRYAPWPGVSLRDGLFHVQQQGFSAINHTYLNFELTANTYLADSDPGEHLSWFRPEPFDLGRVNGWRRLCGSPAEIAWSGNHIVRFSGRSVFPYNFLCKHYPIRSLEQGRRKIFQERLPRFPVAERLKGWHDHYDHVSPNDMLRPTTGLLHYDSTFQEDFLLERLTGVGFAPLPSRMTPKIRLARVLRKVGLLDRALTLRWRLSGRVAK